MSKRYDPIMCMMVDDSVKTKDVVSNVKVGNKYKVNGKEYKVIRANISQNIVSLLSDNFERLDMKFDEFMKKAKDSASTLDEPTKAHDELSLAQKKQVVTELKGYLKKSYNFSDESEYARAYEDLRHMFTTGSRKSISGLFENTVKKTGAHDSASTLDEAIKTADGMFSKAFGEYSKGAKFKKDKFLKELAGIEDAKEFASKMQTFDNELRKNLERLDEAYNVAGQDYYSARNEIRSIMDAFSKEAFGLYRKLDTK